MVGKPLNNADYSDLPRFNKKRGENMIIFTNDNGEIKDVETNKTGLPLTEVEVTDGTFNGWSTAKICCYKVTVQDGFVTMMTPYVDSRLIEHIDQLGTDTETNTANIDYIAMETGIILDMEGEYE